MENLYTPPLSINFVWNPSDAKTVTPILDVVKKSFARDKDKPFSRGLNIPIFYFSTQNSCEVPIEYPQALAKNNVVFVFTSVNTLGQRNWMEYIEKLPSQPSNHIAPIAIDESGLSHNGSLRGLNCIRAYDWPAENRMLHSIVSLAHEIYRFGCMQIDPDKAGKDSSITIFLSHSKRDDTGREHSKKIKNFIDSNTNMNQFFDATEIVPGFHFEEEIEKHIPGSTLLAVESDTYSSRYWCQREILSAKQKNCPIVVVNCLNDYEDRIFPAASNVPCVHVPSDTPLSEKNVLRILSATIIETIRYRHSMECLQKYKEEGWIDQDCELIARPPEIRQVLNFKKNGHKKICYPEPPIYSEEADWHSHLDVNAYTPLWNFSDQKRLARIKVGISISDVQGDGFSSNHIDADYFIRLAQDLARHLLARSATLLYGGDLRPGGFTQFILDEATVLKDRIGGDQPYIENHLAWSKDVPEEEIVAWRAKYRHVMDTKEYEIPSDVANGLSKDMSLPSDTPQSLYIRSRSLTEMREKSISASTVRICAGGKTFGYQGKMPGVLEEIILALNSNKPLFLLGAFGGIVGDVCKVILTSEVPNSLTEEWQASQNGGYSDLQKLAHANGHGCNYELIVNTIKQFKVSKLSTRAGLSEDEYRKLLMSPFVDECIHIILKGLSNITTKESITLQEYEIEIADTDNLPKNTITPVLLGLYGEVGSIMSASKKYSREKEAYTGYKEAVKEEFGDVLWYFSTLCRRLEVDLKDVFKFETDESQVKTILTNNHELSPILPNSPGPMALGEALIELGCMAANLLKVKSIEDKRGKLVKFANLYIQAIQSAELNFAEVIKRNLDKAQELFYMPEDESLLPTFGASFPEEEQLPRQFEIHFIQRRGQCYLRWNDVFIGTPLTDNIKESDGYRFHDVFHLAYAAILHWSPTFRALIKKKRKSDPEFDEKEDGGRAIVVEEGLTAWLFSHAKGFDYFKSHDRVSVDVLKTIQKFIRGYEVEKCPLKLWEKAILQGYDVFRQVRDNEGGIVIGDRDTRTIKYLSNK